jgi:hypothetical protein
VPPAATVISTRTRSRRDLTIAASWERREAGSL